MGVDKYVAHPEAEIYLVSVVGEGHHYVGPVADFDWEKVDGCDAVAHNARFDETVFPEAQKRGQIPASVRINEWHCTADLAVYLGAPRSLLGAAEALLGKTISKAYRVTAEDKTYSDFTEEELKIVMEAGISDAETSLELWEKFNHLWPEGEQTISRLNREITRKGCTIDVALLDKALDTLSTRLWEYGNDIPWDWSDNKTPLSPKKIRMQCRKEGIPSPSSFAEDSEECQEWEATYGDDYPFVRVLRDWRKAHSLHGKLQRIKSRLRVDPVHPRDEADNFPYTIKYFGAHTGRFSGDGGFNMQNIYSKEREGYNVRHMFIARPGKKLLIVDYAQIEARILLWFANDLPALELIREGHSVYEVHARTTMGYTGADDLKTVDPMLYKLAKARVLGLGYGCGATTFQTVAKAMAGLELSAEECQKTVWDYRAANRPITSFWSRLDSLLRGALNSADRTLTLGLPSGREMNYYNVAALDGKIGVQPGLRANRVGTWGGKLTENVVQATGRDILADGWVNIDKAFTDPEELRLLFHVHDEFVFEVDPDIDVSKVEAVLTVAPDWAKTLPLDVESEMVDHYKK